MVSKICPNCGINFIVSNQNKNQECCNRKCKTELNNKRKTKQCEYCNKPFVANKTTSRYCSKDCNYKARKIYDDVNCLNCNKQFKYLTKNRNIYCSKKCYSEYTQKQNKLKPPKIKEPKLFSLIYFNSCNNCGAKFTSKRKNSKYCNSDECTKERIRIYQYILKNGKTNKTCKECKKEFEFYKSKYSSFCSDACSNSNIKKRTKESNKKRKSLGLKEKDNHRKRAKKYNTKYENGITISKLKERDGDKCLICNKKVLKNNVSGYHKLNATVGHIIAMCNGGNHTMQNVQLECMECNIKKGTKNEGQLRLF